MGTGVLVAVVGPSGVGKDTLIGHAKASLAGDDGFVFVRRLVTRGENAFEDHDTLDEAAFAEGVEAGRFPVSWRAHGLGYALPAATLEAIEAGAVVICNFSRGAIAAARERFPAVRVVAISAPDAILAARLIARGRETEEGVAARLAREAVCAREIDPDLTIVNDRPIEQSGGELVAYLKGLRTTASA
ncbi:phosphonate metabolism protein/1,5-bisphosphokinase (PRPP-forming) PhnN [Kaistia nematophila]|uniref:Ribose 1,5-bisphosphate phosphokinase PhnN n=1 Tax=Kaistia nematophila TaxID=2994654 RepID=A0A9X3E7Q4_9HYPH|nr:phosphonate metabolism protein/1,5-bisphosphokinase (PRPP-forming) PhnN [Kaistia nematophila]MCX5571048.1 phosphonate metabolism protein/1,5-bisphosphokinase (PRPP-forming) PhnN [Kaistia nematophila]